MLPRSMRISSICYFKAPSNMLQHIATRKAKRMQHVEHNNATACCVVTLRPFSQLLHNMTQQFNVAINPVLEHSLPRARYKQRAEERVRGLNYVAICCDVASVSFKAAFTRQTIGQLVLANSSRCV